MKTIIIILLFTGIIFSQDKPELVDSVFSVKAYGNAAQTEFQQNVEAIDRLQKRNIFLQGYMEALLLAEQNGLDSVKIKIEKPKKEK